MGPAIVLITGANRGIGKGTLELYLEKPSHTVIAANSDLNHPISRELVSLPRAECTPLDVIKVEG
jgi:norsolorinic acid ketoreductase